jgi:hypothetical protein
MKKNKKFLLVPNTDEPYDRRMMTNLGLALAVYGHEFIVAPSGEIQYIFKYHEYNPDTIIAVNKSRPKDGAIKRSVVFISWFQDVYPESSKNLYFESNDRLYLLGTSEQLGLDLTDVDIQVSSLYTGVPPNINVKRTENLCDFLLCGGLPLDIDAEEMSFENKPTRKNLLSLLLLKINVGISGRNFLGFNCDGGVVAWCKNLIRSHYVPLEGGLDIHRMDKIIKNALNEYDENIVRADKIILTGLKLLPALILKKLGSPEQIKKLRHLMYSERLGHEGVIQSLSSWMAQSYPRIVERELLIHYAERVSKNIKVYGNHMDQHKFSMPYYCGVLSSDHSLAEVYANASINLGNNTHGLGLHSRNLGVMQAGGYLLHHRTTKNLPGSLEAEFEEGTHYDAYSSLDEFEEISKEALASPRRRAMMGEESRKVVMAKHTWGNRAEQILGDLQSNS